MFQMYMPGELIFFLYIILTIAIDSMEILRWKKEWFTSSIEINDVPEG